MSIQKIILERNKEFEEFLDNPTDLTTPLDLRNVLLKKHHNSNILLIEEVIRELEGMRKDTHGVFEPILVGDTRVAGIVHYGYNEAIDDQIYSLTKSLEEIRNLA